VAPVLVEDVKRHGGESVIRVQGVIPDISGGDPEHGYPGRACYLAFEAVEMLIDGLRFPSCVGKNGVVDLRENPFG
jgi:hypothetical protein